MGNKTGHLPYDDKLEGKHRTRPVVGGPSKKTKKKVAKKPQSMDTLMGGKDWRNKGVKKTKAKVTKRAAAPKKKKFVSKRVIKKPTPLTAKQKADKAEALARKKRAMKVKLK